MEKVGLNVGSHSLSFCPKKHETFLFKSKIVSRWGVRL